MTISSLEQQLQHIESQYDGYPPVQDWHPAYQGKIDIRIDREGQWFHEGGKIERDALVQMFAKILIKEGGEYFLVTPAEKLAISVECAPIVIRSLVRIGEGDSANLFFTTNTNEKLHLASPLAFETIECNGQQLPCLPLRNGLQALVHRNVYYELAALVEIDEDESAYIVSNNEIFYLPPL